LQGFGPATICGAEEDYKNPPPVSISDSDPRRLCSAAEKLPFFDHLKQKGVKKTDRLPFGCMTWFSVSPLPEK